MSVIAIVAGIVVAIVVIVGVASTRSRPAVPLPPALAEVLAAEPWHKLDNECWTRDRKPAPTIFFMPRDTDPHNIWVHYYESDAAPIPGLTVEVCAAPGSSSETTELPGLPDGLNGSVSFQTKEDGRWIDREVSEEQLALAREWLANIEPLATLRGGKVVIDPSHVAGFRINVYWDGGAADELALAVRILESVEASVVRR